MEEGCAIGYLRERLARLPAFLDELLFPERVRCLCCSAAIGEDVQDGICPDCHAALEEMTARMEALNAPRETPLPPGIDYVSAAFPYEEQARRLIWRLKFDRVRIAAEPLARAMSRLPGGEEELIVPVPTTKRRLADRGFNHAALIAHHLGEALGMPVVEALSREDDHGAQFRLSAGARAKNLVGCMSADGRVRGRRVLLVDDVYTTGSTAMEAARALGEAGAAGVGVFVAARTQARTARKRAKTGARTRRLG